MKDKLTPKELIYLDLDGNIHSIPYSIGHINNAYKSRCWFVTTDTIFVEGDDDGKALNDLNGRIVFDAGDGWMNYLGDNYLSYYDSDEGKYGVIDGHGNIVIEPQFDNIVGVLR